MVEPAQDFIENNNNFVNCEDCNIRLISAEYANRYDENGEFKYENITIHHEMFKEGYKSEHPSYYMAQSVLSEFSDLGNIFDKNITFEAYVTIAFNQFTGDYQHIGNYSANVSITAKTTDKEWRCMEVIFDNYILSTGGRLAIWQINECIGRANTFLDCLKNSNLADKTDQKSEYPLLQIEKLDYFDYYPKIKKINRVPTIIQREPRKPLTISKSELQEALENVILKLDPNNKVEYEIHIRLVTDAFWSNAIFYVEDTEEGNLFYESICSSETNYLLDFASNSSNYWLFVKKDKKVAFEKILKRYCVKYNTNSVENKIISKISEFGLRSVKFSDGESVQMSLDYMGMCLNSYYWYKKDNENEYIHIVSC